MPKFLTSWLRSIWRWLKEPRVIWRQETPHLQITIEIQSWLPFPFFLAVLLWYLAAPSPVSMMSAVTLGGLILASFLWARQAALHVRGRRKLRFAAMQVGDELEEQITLWNRSPLPVLWAEFIDRSSIPGYTVSSARAAGPYSQVEWRAHTVCTRRGVYNLGPWELRTGEPFGLFLVRQVNLQFQEILVYPPLAELPNHLLAHLGAMGRHRPLNQPLRAETIVSNTVRAYVPGDPLRHIHWPTTARRVDPFVKVFAPEAASNIWLVPDFDLNGHVGEGDLSSVEVMVTVVASLAAALLQQNLSVGLLASSDVEKIVLPRQGYSHLWSILRALVPLQAAPDHSLAGVLRRAKTLLGANDLLALVTPSLSPEWVAPLRRDSRSRGGSRSEVVLLDPRSFGGDAPADDFLRFLLDQGLTAHLLRRDDVRMISGSYGEISRWEFAVLGTGRVITRKSPRAASRPAGSPAPDSSDRVTG